MENNARQEDGVKHPSALKLFFTIKSPTERFSRFENMVEAFLVYAGIFFFTYRTIYTNATIWDSLAVNILLVYMYIGAYIISSCNLTCTQGQRAVGGEAAAMN